MSNKQQAILIGPGRWGTIVKKYLIQHFDLIGEYNSKTYTPDVHRQCRVAFICTPPETHFEIARQAMIAGQHVFLEKTPCTTPEECDVLYEHALRKDVALHVNYLYRYDPMIQYLAEITRVTAPNSINITFLKKPHTNRIVIEAFGSHCLSIAHVLSHSKALYVMSFGHDNRNSSAFCWNLVGSFWHVHNPNIVINCKYVNENIDHREITIIYDNLMICGSLSTGELWCNGVLFRMFDTKNDIDNSIKAFKKEIEHPTSEYRYQDCSIQQLVCDLTK